MPRHFLYIVNPISGTKSKSGLENLVRKKTTATGFPFAIFPSVEGGDYSFLDHYIKEQKVTDIVIAGGDGTINQAINYLRKWKLPFGIIPCGSGNGLALTAGIPKSAEKALDVIFTGTPQWTDAFTINGKFACMLCGLGFDAQVAHDFANDPNRGLTTYIKQTVKNFLTSKSYTFGIRTKGRTFITDAFFISVANSNQFGNNFKIAPSASLTDGMLDIVIMTKQNKLSMLVQALKQVTGFNEVQETAVFNEQSSVIYFQAPSITINNALDAPLHIDGDPVETEKQLKFQVIPSCFQLLVSKN